MPYLPLDLDAKRLLEAIERGLSLPRHTMVGGAMEMWEAVWRQKSALVDSLTLWAAFGPSEHIPAALVSRGFLEPTTDGKFRVCGAEQWLFGMKGKSRGGHAAKGNLIPGAKQKKKAKEASALPRDSAEKTHEPAQVLSASAETQPRPPLGTLSALSPSIPASQQALNTSPPKTAADDGGYQLLVKNLFERFRMLRGKDPEPTGKDWKALKRLRGRTKLGDAEILIRWERGLRAQFKQQVDSFADLDAKWDSLASADPPSRAGNARDITRGMVRAQDVDQTSFAKIGISNDL